MSFFMVLVCPIEFEAGKILMLAQRATGPLAPGMNERISWKGRRNSKKCGLTGLRVECGVRYGACRELLMLDSLFSARRAQASKAVAQCSSSIQRQSAPGSKPRTWI